MRCSSGAEMRIHAHLFVLAAGGIENARLLLLSRFACRRGLGNEHDQVGRYLMNHPKETLGTIQLRRPCAAGLHIWLFVRGFFGLPRVASARFGARGAWSAERPPRLQPALESGWWRGASGLRRKASRLHSVATRNFLAMEPEAENRVMLSVRRDALGQPLARVRHRVSALGRCTLRFSTGRWRRRSRARVGDGSSPAFTRIWSRGRSSWMRPTIWGRHAWVSTRSRRS